MQKTLHNSRLNDLVTFLCSLGIVALALLGMGGIVYHALAPDGLIQLWLGRLWVTHPGLGVLVVVGVITVVLTARTPATGYRNLKGSSDVPLYVFVAIGTFFAVRWLWQGA